MMFHVTCHINKIIDVCTGVRIYILTSNSNREFFFDVFWYVLNVKVGDMEVRATIKCILF